MTGPPKFPRIAVLNPDRASRDDLVVEPAARDGWFGPEVVVEEKLDGANVAVWRDDQGVLRCMGRGGLGAMDRAGQLGRLRAWVSERHLALTQLLAERVVLYGEWLYLEHSTRYERLPDWLVVLDLWSPDGGFVTVEERDLRCVAAGVPTVPVLFRGVLRSERDLVRLVGLSAFGTAEMEGLVLRKEGDGRLLDRVKWLRPDFVRIDAQAWARGRPRNALAP